jgi:hypothetical protein
VTDDFQRVLKRAILIFFCGALSGLSMGATADRQNKAKELVDKASVFCVNGRDYSSKLLGAASGLIAQNGGSNVFETKEKAMITALVQFKLPQPVTLDKARELFSSTAPKYRDVQGLIRKYYILSEDGMTAGGVYLWRSRADAERLYTDDWKKFIVEKYGTEPTVQYFFSPVIVDNLIGEILKDE